MQTKLAYVNISNIVTITGSYFLNFSFDNEFQIKMVQNTVINSYITVYVSPFELNRVDTLNIK